MPYQTQIRRLEDRIERLAKTLKDFDDGKVTVSSDPRAVIPERALVLELRAPVREFEIAAQALGFDWLTSMRPPSRGADTASDEEGDQLLKDVDDGVEEDDDQEEEARVLYVTMPTADALRSLLAAWKQYKSEGTPLPGQESLFKLFGYLLELRTWSAKDRIDPAIAQYVRMLLASDPERPVLVEVSLWYRTAKEMRDEAIATLQALVKQESGELVDLVHIPEIQYQAALASLPAAVAAKLIQGEGSLPNLNEVMSIRPQSAYEPVLDESELETSQAEPSELPAGQCISVLLDGYPIEGHTLLKDRVIVHEKDVSGKDVPPKQRVHGTAMASLVAHGDLHVQQPSINRPVGVIPVMGLHPNGSESTPLRKLAVGVIYRALQEIVRLRATDSKLSRVVVVNHSLGDTNAPFVRRPSPWAALLDYYSHYHQLLFVISAGNILGTFPCPAFADIDALLAASPPEREATILNALRSGLGKRSIISPAESINSLTVGALHQDASGDGGSDIDPFPTMQITNLASAVGPGVNKGIKPDMLEQGGRFAAGPANVEGGGLTIHAKRSVHMGHLVASPSNTGQLDQTRRLSGTSNAAALVTRSCNILADALDQVFAGETAWHDRATRAVILKALAAHGCAWGDAGDILETTFDEDVHWARRRSFTSKLLGYGSANLGRVVAGQDNRVTLLAEGALQPEQLHEYRLPIPASVLNTKEVRRLTVTLAWTTPTITTTADYRGVALQLVDGNGKQDFWKEGASRTQLLQPTLDQSKHGTLIHYILQGAKKIKPAQDGKGIFLGVQARARHDSQAKATVPYAMAITLEMAVQAKIYQEIRNALRARAASQRSRA